MRARKILARELRTATRRLGDVFAPGGRLVVGYSGGQDSTALLHALSHLRVRLDLVAVHVDHALRSDSGSDAALVREAGAALGVAVEVVRVDVAAYRRGLAGWSVQQAARAARYHALAQVAEARSAHAVLVAHTADDQAETVLLHLMRGAGLAGLGGMRPDESVDPVQLGPTPAEWATAARPIRLARPLLHVARANTAAYCGELGLSVIEDASNQSRTYTRNRVRLDLMPVLERFNPAIRTVLARTADLAAEDVAALDRVVAQLARSVVGSASRDALTFDLAAWRLQPRGLQRRLLRHGLAELLGTLVDVGAAPIDDALDLLTSASPGATYHLPYGIELRLETDVFHLDLHGQAIPPQRSRKIGSVEGARV